MASTSTHENIRRWLLALAGFAIVVFFFSPSWAAFSLWARVPEMGGMMEVRRGVSVLAQVAHPGAPVVDPLHAAIQWRLLFPLVAHVLGLPPSAFFALADVGCLLVLGYLVSLVRKAGYTWTEALLAMIAFGAASWFFVSTGWLGYFDSWLAFALLLVACDDRAWVVWLTCLWAPWVDERFVLAAPLALLCRWIYRRIEGGPEAAKNWKRDYGVSAGLLLLFLIGRLALLSSESATNATLIGYFTGKNYLDAPMGRILLGVWEGLRLAWVFVVVAIALTWRMAGARQALILAAASVAMVVAGLATAQDYSRSMTMLLPVAATGLLLIGREKPAWRMRVFGVGAAAALVLPAHHVVQNQVNPIFYLYHELQAFSSPAPAAMPELRELSAVYEMEAGDFAAAERDLTLAIKLAPDPTSPAKRRGVLYASARRWKDAKEDFSLMIQHEPDNPDGWFLRSEIELATSDFSAAREDFEHARSIAPSGWADRPDVKRYTALYERQMNGR